MQPVTGASTPNSAASLRPFNLAHGSIEHVLLVPNSLYLNCSQLRDQFYTTLPTPTEDNAADGEPASPTELLAAFLGYVAKTVSDEPGPYDEVLSLILNEFETRYLRGNDVHAVAAALQIPKDSNTSTAKVASVVKSYYAARIASNRPVKPHDSALLRAADESQASIKLIFGGQGNTEDYFDELVEIYNIYGDLISDLFDLLSNTLLNLSRTHKDAKRYFPRASMSWTGSPTQTQLLTLTISFRLPSPFLSLVSSSSLTLQ